MNEESGNIQQRVFDAFPPWPALMTIDSLVGLVPFPRESIRKALKRLKKDGRIELAPRNACCVYRLIRDARRPIDMRGHHGNSGRRPKRAD